MVTQIETRLNHAQIILEDGQGFEVGQSHPGHLGLVSMEEQVMLVGGEFHIECKPGQGTAVELYVAAVVCSADWA